MSNPTDATLALDVRSLLRMARGRPRVPHAARVLAAAVVLLAVAVASPSDATVRRLEAVGSVPVRAGGSRDVVPREQAINMALEEAVTRVAMQIFDERAQLAEDGSIPPDPEKIDWVDILGKKMLRYTGRFRVVEDRGEQPALFSQDPKVEREYVVIVEVDVDVDTIDKRLVERGLIPAGIEAAPTNRVRVEVLGLSYYPAYVALRELLLGEVGAVSVVPVEIEEGRTLLEVEITGGPGQLLRQILRQAPPELEIESVGPSEEQLYLTVHWVALETADTSR